LTKKELSGQQNIVLTLKFPLSEIITDFQAKLKTLSSGYATFDYEILGFEKSDLVKVKVLTNGQEQETLSLIVYRGFAYEKAKKIVSVLSKVIPRANFEIVVQAKVEGRIVARETLSALKKNVTSRIHGGGALDRKMKL
jgi:GTP-binding protein LepA